MGIRSFTKQLFGVSLFVVLGLLAVRPAQAQSTSDRYGVFDRGQYRVQNNEWGLENASGQVFSQSIWASSGNNAWSVAWSWPWGNGQLKSYPSIVRGWHYQKWSPDAGGFPTLVSDNKVLTTTASWNMNVSGNYDIAYDLFFGAEGNPGGPGAELMVWLQWSGQSPAGSKVASAITIQGVPGTWDVWQGWVGWPVWSFVPTSQYGWTGSCSLNLQPFVWQCAYERTWLARNWYILNIEFGIEINNGSGTLNVTDFTGYVGGTPVDPSVDLPTTITLKALANSKYVCADNGGDSALIANRTSISDWEKFTVSKNSDGSYSFKSKVNGQFVCADNWGNNALIANRTSASGWESFWIN
jgi:xyloglucan-specific endo-beta-1,4-glucanase